ncbi:hypothetical protein [Phocaeicola sp.]
MGNILIETLKKKLEKLAEKFDSPFEHECFIHFILGGGKTKVLADDVFARVVTAAEGKKPVRTCTFSVEGKTYTGKLLSFYDIPEFDYAFGHAYVYYDEAGTAVGFSDIYDFDPGKHREAKEEAITALVAEFQKIFKAKPYKVVYGIYDENNVKG